MLEICTCRHEVVKELIMFCSNCGKEIDEKAVVCVHCGCATNNYTSKGKKEKYIAVLLAIFLGGFGVHRFYMNQTNVHSLLV